MRNDACLVVCVCACDVAGMMCCSVSFLWVCVFVSCCVLLMSLWCVDLSLGVSAVIAPRKTNGLVVGSATIFTLRILLLASLYLTAHSSTLVACRRRPIYVALSVSSTCVTADAIAQACCKRRGASFRFSGTKALPSFETVLVLLHKRFSHLIQGQCLTRSGET